MGSEARARVALFGLQFAALLAFGQLFAESTYSGPAVFGMLISLGIAVGGRRLGLPAFTTTMVSVAGLVWFVCIVFQSQHLFYGLPSIDALDRIGRLIERAYTLSNVDFAPVPMRPGYVILTVVAMWVCTTFAELATFRWRRPILASLPAIALFSFLLVVGSGNGSWLLIVMFLSTLLAFWGLESTHRIRSWGRWVEAFGDSEKAGDPIMARVGRRMGVSCVVVALAAPLVLPAIDEGLLSWRNSIGGGGSGGGSGRIDLLLDIRPQLIEQSDTELFSIRSRRAAYWRLASLAAFDGRVWSPSPESAFAVAPEGAIQVAHRVPVGGDAEVLRQRVTIHELEGEALPAAITPTEIRFDEGADLRTHPATGELRIENDLSPDLGYEVTSVVTDVSFEDLKDAEIGNLEDRTYRELPDIIIPPLYDIAERWTRKADTPFEKLVAIQDRFRGGSFHYSQSPEVVEASASSDYLFTFLNETKTGYCQQFAAAFAALARSLTYPSRVSVGFLPGSPDPNDPESYLVRGTDAHAWPEVYFADYGWVAFEPTPRSGAASANAPLYTAPAIDNPVGFGAFSGDPSTPGNLDDILSATGERLGVDEQGAAGAGGPAERQRRRARNDDWYQTFTDLLVIVLAVTGLFLLLVPALKEVRIRRRYSRAGDPNRIAGAAFTTFELEAAELASPRAATESASEYARRLGAAHAVPSARADRLARLYEAAEYSAEGISQRQADEAKSLAGELRTKLWKRASWIERARRLFSPRTLTT